MKMYSRTTRAISAFLLVSLMLELCAPAISFAITSGPSQPEFSGFEPLGTTGMVNEFTGQFTYNIPLLEVPGPNGSSYPLNLSYHSGASPEEDASWVGYGWSLNAGAVNRSVRGFPDDYHEDDVQFINKQPTVATWVLGAAVTAQAFSYDLFEFEHAIRYNTMTGFSSTSGFSISLLGFMAFNWRIQSGVTRFTVTPNWMQALQWAANNLPARETQSREEPSNAAVTSVKNQSDWSYNPSMSRDAVFAGYVNYLSRTNSQYGMPATTSNTNSVNIMGSYGNTIDAAFLPFGVIGGTTSIRGGVTLHTSDENTTMKAFGMLYTGTGSNPGAQYRIDDYMRDRESDFSGRDLFLSPSYAMNDQFVIGGHGVTGVCQFVHKIIGSHGPRKADNLGISATVGFESSVGFLKIGSGVGIKIGATTGSTQRSGSPLSYSTPFYPTSASRHVLEHAQVALRMKGESGAGIRYTGNNNVLTPTVSSSGTIASQITGNLTGGSNTSRATNVQYRSVREIGYSNDANSATNGSRYLAYSSPSSIRPYGVTGGDGYYDYTEAAIQDRIGEIAVTNATGSTYVYGLPVFARNEKSITYSQQDITWKKKNHFKIVREGLDPNAYRTEQTKLAPYGSGFLLTEIYGTNYVDLGNKGPSSEDLGGWVSLRYIRTAGFKTKALPPPGPNTDGTKSTSARWYRWRTPYHGYQYAAGSNTQAHDDRASVAMGEKELYYMQTIETKTHLAVFINNKTDITINVNGSPRRFRGSMRNRLDGFEARNGGDWAKDEWVQGEYPNPKYDLVTSIDPTTAGSVIGIKSFGGKGLGSGREARQKIDADWMNRNTRENKSRYLEKVILIAKDASGNLKEVLQTVNLEYTYELMSHEAKVHYDYDYWDNATETTKQYGLPFRDTIYKCEGILNSAFYFTNDKVNAKHTATSVNMAQYGKLTLKKIWTDYGEVKNRSIAPYEFSYIYPRRGYQSFSWGEPIFNSTSFGPVWQDAASFGETYTTATGSGGDSPELVNKKLQNPAYDPVDVDAWGSYSSGAREMYGDRRVPYTDQRLGAGGSYDPAAWQLKVIKLPSGGRIHVQYEQNTYSHVQDKDVMAMIRLADIEITSSDVSCYLNIDSELPGRFGANYVKDKLIEYLKNDDRLYFKFLYPLSNCGIPVNQIGYMPSNGEYIDGFVPVKSGDVTVTSRMISGVSKTVLKVKLTGEPQPAQLMREYLFNRNANFPRCSGSKDNYQAKHTPNSTESGANDKSQWSKVLGAGGAISDRNSVVNSLYSSATGGAKPYINYSYLRIPCIWKYGAGVRVKRVFLHDQGLESGLAGLYGTEYLYDNAVGTKSITSGVATNEPQGLHDENPYFSFLVGKESQSWYEKITAGEEIDQFSGPICESALPSPSIGYGKVIARSIAQVKTSPGYTISEFYTARDFPVKIKWSPIQKRALFEPLIMTGIVNVQSDAISAAQGFLVETNSMHGKPKSVTKCAGNNIDIPNIVESITYNYFAPGATVKVLSRASDGSFSLTDKTLSTEEDYHQDARVYESTSISGAANIDWGINITLMFPFPLINPYFHGTFPTINTAMSKVNIRTLTRTLHYQPLLKSTTLYRGGIKTTTENAAFDEITGSPLIVKTFDDQQNRAPYSSGNPTNTELAYTVPAYMYYAGMGSKSVSEGLASSWSTTAVTYNSGTSTLTISSGALSTVQVGDILVLSTTTSTPTGRSFRVTASNGSGGITALPTYYGGSASFATGNYRIMVARSGCANRVTEPAFTYSTHGNNLATSSTIPTTISNVLRAQGVVYSDDWTSKEFPTRSVPAGFEYDYGVKGRWYPCSTWVYNSLTGSIVGTSTRVTASGKATSAMPRFVHNGAQTGSWIFSSATKKVSPDGDVSEEVNALDIPSTAIIGYRSSVPVMIGQNAEAGTIAFEHFEDVPTSGVVVTAAAHTGKQSRQISTSYAQMSSLELTTRVKSGGLIVKAWFQTRMAGQQCSVKVGSVAKQMILAPQVNGWHLAETVFTSSDLTSLSTGTTTIEFKVTAGTGTFVQAYVDDIRIQPAESSTTCYVYDASSLRLIAQFDDRHYAQLFKFDQEGRLSRKDRETQRGVSPIQEVHMNTPGVNFATQTSQMLLYKPIQTYDMESPYDALQELDEKTNNGAFTPSKIGGTFDVLQLKVTPEKVRYNVFGTDTVEKTTDSVLGRKP